MALKAEQLKGELTDKVVRQVRDRLRQDKADLIERFVRQFYANVPPDDILQASPEQLYGAALAIWQFGAGRTPGVAKVRVYNPRPESHGWQSPHTVVEIVNDDMPFLVDSVTAELHRLGLTVHLVIHPVVRVRRDAEGRLVELYEPGSIPAGAQAESFMHVEIDEQGTPETLEEIRQSLETVLAQVRAAVADWHAMRQCIREVAERIRTQPLPVPEAERAEAEAFLLWLDAHHFTFLGYREYRFTGNGGADGPGLAIVPGVGLGILRDDSVVVFDGLRHFASLPVDVQHFLRQPNLLLVTKANRRAQVHRPVHMDAVFVKTFDAEGRVVGQKLFLGLFTSAAYNRSPREIPYLRRKVESVVNRSGFDPLGHDGKALVNILETFPRDELFQISEDDLYDIALGVLHLQERQRTALFVRRDPFERFVSCLVYVPRDRYDTDLRRRIQALLEEAFNGTCTAFYTQLAESVLARVHFIIKTEPGRVPDVDVQALEARLAEESRAWPDRLRDALVEAHGEGIGLALLRRYAGAFPVSYRETFSAEVAVFDIDRIEDAMRQRRLGLNLYRPIEAAAHELRLKIYQPGPPVPLSDVLPMLEHMGLRVISEGGPFEVKPANRSEPVWIHDFQMTARDGAAVDLMAVKQPFEEAFARIWDGSMEDDGFNRLVLRAGLSWRQVAMVRAYARFLRQARFAFSQDYMEDALAAHPHITGLIVRLFETWHDPAHRDRAETAARGLLVEIEHALDAVANLDEDRILRRFVNLVVATLRTNYFQRQDDGTPKPYLSLKLDSRAIDDLPLPRPWCEIFVYSPRVEAVHLRGGKVARGGIRWSDRREDFRTEVLGLMKAQMVKNAVIVPVGAKGGFVVKRPPPAEAGREALMAEGIDCYRTMMRGLLDVTDNLSADGTVLPPPDVVRRDEDDAYLVVAADKGTAIFSDIANGIAAEYGYWLGDAFASGGSRGYDHKKMGITARGAWESVKRHFRELGIDCQSQDFTCVGVGDMSGDVFGNGMLLSRHIRLIAAFDHRHIFCDPNPDPAISYQERRRLFELPRSSWADYDPARLSPGGGVFDRKAKSITLSPEIRASLGLMRERVTPAELIQAILRAEVDLLWFGGIGTYVKATDESHADVGDKANDALRVNAGELRARIVGEGANLAMTQRARVEFALRGGRINTDFIDNSAGVDTSDHEVNIKILLNEAMARGALTQEERDRLLDEMTDEVAQLVLSNNYLQTQAISVTEAQGPELLESQARFMRTLEKQGHLNRALERLPDDEELSTRQLNRQGLTRPEIAVLLAYAKITLNEELLASDLPDDPGLSEDLARYFPRPLRRAFGEAIARHRLRREIIVTYTVNSMVNRVGPTFVRSIIDRTGMPPSEIARAYAITRDVFELRLLWSAIEALDNKVAAACQIEMILETNRLMERAVTWFLTHGRHPLDIAEEGKPCRSGVAALAGSLDAVLVAEDRAQLEARTAAWNAQGVPAELARRIASLPVLAAALDLTRIGRDCGRTVPAVAAVYFALGQRFGIEWLRTQARAVKTDNHWQKQAVSAIIDDLYAHQAQLASKVLGAAGGAEGEAALEAWVAQRKAPVDRVLQLLGELRAVPAVDLAMLAVANRQLRGLVAL